VLLIINRQLGLVDDEMLDAVEHFPQVARFGCPRSPSRRQLARAAGPLSSIPPIAAARLPERFVKSSLSDDSILRNSAAATRAWRDVARARLAQWRQACEQYTCGRPTSGGLNVRLQTRHVEFVDHNCAVVEGWWW
jgi:hypothetical protein